MSCNGDLLTKCGTGGFYEFGDFNRWIQRPSREEIRKLQQLAPQILEELKSFETPLETDLWGISIEQARVNAVKSDYPVLKRMQDEANND